MAATAAPRTGHWCNDCQELVETTPVYECSRCSEASDERRCADCNIFTARREEDGCENCFAEVEEVQVVTDHDGTLIRAEDYDPNGEAREVRNAKASAAAAAKRAAKEQARANALIAGSTVATWADVRPGMSLAVRDHKGNIDTEQNAAILSLTTAGTGCAAPLKPGDIVAVVQHYGQRVAKHSPTEEAIILGPADPEDLEADLSERITVGAAPRSVDGSPNYIIDAGMGFESNNGSRLLAGYIRVRSTPYSNMSTPLGTFIEPAEALAFATAARKAAETLTVPDTTSDPESDDYYQYTFADSANFPVAYQLTRYARFSTGPVQFGSGNGVVIRVGTSEHGGMTVLITDQRTMLAAAQAAETIAGRLTAALGLQEG